MSRVFHENLIIWLLAGHWRRIKLWHRKKNTSKQIKHSQPNRIHYENRIVNDTASTKIYTSSKYFHFVSLVCFGVKQKYIIDSASTVKQLEIHIDMKKKMERERKIIECKNLYFHSITKKHKKNQHHTRHLLKLRNHESWLRSFYTLLPSFKLHLHLTPRRRAFFSSVLEREPKDEYLIVQGVDACTEPCFLIEENENQHGRAEGWENKKLLIHQTVMIHLWAIK